MGSPNKITPINFLNLYISDIRVMAASNKKPPIALHDKNTMGKSPVAVRWKGSRPLIVDAIQVS